MKKPVYLSLICFSLALIACGKNNNDGSPQASAQPISPAPINPAPPPPTGTNGMTLEQYCRANYGQYNGSTCSFTSSYNLNFSAFGDYPSSVFVRAGDRVVVSVSNSPKVLVGGMLQATGNANFISQTSGNLSFQQYSFYQI